MLRTAATAFKQAAVFLILLCLLPPPTSFSQTAELFLQLGHSGKVNSISFSPTDEIVATASADNTVKIWDLKTRQVLRTLAGHDADIFSVTFSPDGKMLASAGYDAEVIFWNVETGKKLRTGTDFSGPINSIAFASSGNILAAGSRDGTVTIMESGSAKVRFALRGHLGWVNAISFRPNAKLIASGGEDHLIKIWDIEKGQLLKNLGAHTQKINSLDFSPNGEILASASEDGTVCLWDADTWEWLAQFDAAAIVKSLEFSPTQRVLATAGADSTVRLWNVATQSLMHEFSSIADIEEMHFSPDGHLISAACFDQSARFWDARSGDFLFELSGQSLNILAVAFNHAGKRLVTGHEDGSIRIWDSVRGSLLQSFQANFEAIASVDFSPDGKWLVAGSLDGTANIWDLAAGSLVEILTTHSGAIHSAAFSPDSRLLATASADQTIKIWNTGTWTPRQTLIGHLARIWSVDFSPRNGILASAGDDYTVRIWRVATGKLLGTLRGHESLVRSVAFSGDGDILASASSDNTIKIWDQGSAVLTIAAHASSVTSVAFSPDMQLLASGSFDNTIKLWKLPDSRPTKILQGHANDINQIEFSPDGNRLASVSSDGTLKLWTVKTGELDFSIASLPDKQWLAYHPENAFYNSSKNGDNYAALRLDNELHSVVPLAEYRDKLKRIGFVSETAEPVLVDPPEPVIRTPVTRSNPVWLGSALGILLIGFIAAFVFYRRRNPQNNWIKPFFSEAGFSKVTSISPNIMFMEGANGGTPALACYTKDGYIPNSDKLEQAIKSYKQKLRSNFNLYLLYDDLLPSNHIVSNLRGNLAGEVIPLQKSFLEKGYSGKNSGELLKGLEAPYLNSADPYMTSGPIQDPNWFFGHEQIIDSLSSDLAQGNHAGIFGLAKVGKTSLAQKIYYRSSESACAFIDCEPVTKNETHYATIIRQLSKAVNNSSLKTERLKIPTFRKMILTLWNAWKKSGHNEPFIILLDNIDPFLQRDQNQMTQNEAIDFLRVIYDLSKNDACLVVLALGIRPGINLISQISPRVGLNPFYHSMQVEYLGFLNGADSVKMLNAIGFWQGINWESAAAERVFQYSGGHPFVTRCLASTAGEQGKLNPINSDRVDKAAGGIQTNFGQNLIGHFYSEKIWTQLEETEKTALALICTKNEAWVLSQEIPEDLHDAITNLENYGLLANDLGRLSVSAALFKTWIREKATRPV